MSRKLLIVILVTLILVALGGGVLYYSFFFEGSSSENENQEDEEGGLFSFLSRDREISQTQDSGETQNIDTTPNIIDVNGGGGDVGVFRQLWPDYVSGVFIGKDELGTTTIRFVDRATGHVHQTYPDTTMTERITNTTIPKIQEVVWVSLDKLLVRYLQDEEEIIETFAATIIESGVESATSSDDVIGELSGQFLPTNILQIDARGDGDLFYLTEDLFGDVRGIVSNFDGSSGSEVFSSVIRDWLVQWVGESTIALTTKAASLVAGDVLTLNTNTGTLTPNISSVFGLTTLFGDKYILYTGNDGSGLDLFVLNRDTNETSAVPFVTLTEKCVWSATNSSVVFCAVPKSIFSEEPVPGGWYQGVVTFEDQLWKFNVETQQVELLLDPAQFTNEPMDIIAIHTDEDEEYMVFMNKTNGTPWLLQLTEPEAEEVVEN